MLFLSRPSQAGAVPNADTGPIPNFHKVDPNLWRSGRPQPAGLVKLQQIGVKVIIDLEYEDKGAITAEREAAEELGIRHVSLPMNAEQPVSDTIVNQALAILGQQVQSSVLVHCYFGEDRTGLIIGLYRVTHDHWTPEAAYKEMLSLGFHASLTNLDDYFRKRTGMGYKK
jgi:protein tyrosine/serine phosphatase